MNSAGTSLPCPGSRAATRALAETVLLWSEPCGGAWACSRAIWTCCCPVCSRPRVHLDLEPGQGRVLFWPCWSVLCCSTRCCFQDNSSEDSNPSFSTIGVIRSAAWDTAHSILSHTISLWPTKHKVSLHTLWEKEIQPPHQVVHGGSLTLVVLQHPQLCTPS